MGRTAPSENSDNAYIGVPSWAQPPGGLSSLGRWERLAPQALADRRGPRDDLRARPVLASLLRLRSRLPSGPGGLFRNLHSTSLGRVRLVLLGPGPLLFVPDGSGPRPGYDAELSPRVPEPERAALPVVLAPRRTARRAALRRSLELGHVRLAAEHGSLRFPGGLPDVRLAKEAFGRKAGLISAFLLAISVGNLQRSAATDADHDTFTLFFVISTFF